MISLDSANMNLHVVKHLEVLKNLMKEKRRRENADQKEQSLSVEERSIDCLLDSSS